MIIFNALFNIIPNLKFRTSLPNTTSSKRYFLVIICLLLITACTSVPKGIEPVKELDINRYLGQWHEIARLDHSFEKGLSKVTANYQLRDDGGIDVVNRGWSEEKTQWKEAQGKAYRVGEFNGHLKVSFFGPFYGAYVVIELGENYDYSIVTGPSRKYLWLLARTSKVSDQVRSRFKQVAQKNGFDLTNLIWVGH